MIRKDSLTDSIKAYRSAIEHGDEWNKEHGKTVTRFVSVRETPEGIGVLLDSDDPHEIGPTKQAIEHFMPIAEGHWRRYRVRGFTHLTAGEHIGNYWTRKGAMEGCRRKALDVATEVATALGIKVCVREPRMTPAPYAHASGYIDSRDVDEHWQHEDASKAFNRLRFAMTEISVTEHDDYKPKTWSNAVYRLTDGTKAGFHLGWNDTRIEVAIDNMPITMREYKRQVRKVGFDVIAERHPKLIAAMREAGYPTYETTTEMAYTSAHRRVVRTA